MSQEEKKSTQQKSKLHPRNRYSDGYDFKQLQEICPDLTPFVRPNPHGNKSINFFDPAAVKTLNKALLKQSYKLDHWDIPEGYLCPPIPGRADYIHYLADLLAQVNKGKVPRGSKIICLDIGMGASCIYPIIGVCEYGWSFVGTDIDPVSIEAAKSIISLNPSLTGKISIRKQENPAAILEGVIKQGDFFDLSFCNPPFHSSAEEALAATSRKLKNLTGDRHTKPTLNFGGKAGELWRAGGEEKFVLDLINESRKFPTACFWYTTLISKESNLKRTYKKLKIAEAVDVKTIDMGQGNKKSRIVAWTFMTKKQQQIWIEYRWR